MCGIFGYVGPKNAVETVLSGLKKLEYRGYDSAGIAGVHDNQIFFCKEVGKVSELEKEVVKKKLELNLLKEEKENEIAKLQEQIKQKDQEQANSLNVDKENLLNKMKSVEGELEKLTVEFNNRGKSVESHEKTIQEMRREIEISKEKETKVNKSLEIALETARETAQNLEKLTKVNEENEQELIAATGERDNLQKEMVALKEKQKQELIEKDKQLGEITEKFNDLQNKYHELGKLLIPEKDEKNVLAEDSSEEEGSSKRNSVIIETVKVPDSIEVSASPVPAAGNVEENEVLVKVS